MRALTYLAAAAAVLAGLALSARALFGPLTEPISFRSPMNAVGCFALAVLLLLALRPGPPPSAATRGPLWLAVAAGMLPFLFYADFPLLADDYAHIWQAHHRTWSALLSEFATAPPDRFFRPLTYVQYALDARWAGYSPWLWRLGNTLLHGVNITFVGLLARQLGWTPPAATAAALLFGLHGARPEAVTWVAARFDLLALCFSLLALSAVLRHAEQPRRRWLVLAVAAFTIAVLNKEHAYAVPPLAALLLWYRRANRQHLCRTVLVLGAAALVLLAWRTAVLGGVGGYQNAADGRPTIFNLRLSTTGKALTMRLWGTLFEPLNWTHEPGLWLALLLVLSLAAWLLVAWQGVPRRTLLLTAGWVWIAALPVHQFLSIGPDLEKARVLYFPSVGCALLFGALAARTRRSRAAALVILLFQTGALVHNLREWRRVAQLAGRTCTDAAALLRQAPGPVAFTGLANVVDGVYFLKTGIQQCVAFQVPERASDIRTAPRAGERAYRWEETSRTLRPLQ